MTRLPDAFVLTNEQTCKLSLPGGIFDNTLDHTARDHLHLPDHRGLDAVGKR